MWVRSARSSRPGSDRARDIIATRNCALRPVDLPVASGRDTAKARRRCRMPIGWRNSGHGTALVVVESTPPGAMQSFFETFCGLAHEGTCDDQGQPPLLQVAASMPLSADVPRGPADPVDV